MRSLFILVLVLMVLPVWGQDRKNLVLLDRWTDLSIAPGPEDVRFNDVFGFTHKGDNYAVIGSSIGTHILKIADGHLLPVDFVPGKYQHITVEHRDYAVYTNFLYAVCDEGNSSLQVIDFSHLPDSVFVVYDSSSLFSTAHTVFADTLTGRLYACGTNNAAMKILDISNPSTPALFQDFNGVSYVHDCYVVNDTAFLNCGFDGLYIYRFGGPFPQQLGVLDFYAGQGYNHSGSVSPDGNKYAFTDETEGTRIKLCQLGDPGEISVTRQFGTADYETNIPHNVILLNRLAICSYYNEGLRIFDLSRSPVREIAAYDTFEPETAFKLNGAWGVFAFTGDDLILVSDRQGGLFLFDFPITLLESGNTETSVFNTPFIDENSILIPRDYFDRDGLSFTIVSASGQLVYEREDYINWVNIPLHLAPGVYFFRISDSEGHPLESGSFVKAN